MQVFLVVWDSRRHAPRRTARHTRTRVVGRRTRKRVTTRARARVVTFVFSLAARGWLCAMQRGFPLKTLRCIHTSLRSLLLRAIGGAAHGPT